MNNQTTTKSIVSHGLIISLGHLASIFSLLFILILILITLFILFTKQKNNCTFDDNERPSGMSTSASERKSFPFRQSRQYSSTTSGQANPSISLFRMDIDDHNTRSTTNLLSTK